MNDVIYKVAVVSSNLDIIAIIISAIGVLFSAGLSGILIYQTSKNNLKNTENEIKIAEYQQKIEFFDKRLSLYQTLSKIYNVLSFNIQTLTIDTPNLLWFDLFKTEAEEWYQSLTKNALISEFLFDSVITVSLNEIIDSVLTVNMHLRILYSEINPPIKLGKYEETNYLVDASNKCLHQLQILKTEFETSNILKNIKNNLQIKI